MHLIAENKACPAMKPKMTFLLDIAMTAVALLDPAIWQLPTFVQPRNIQVLPALSEGVSDFSRG